MRFCVLPLMLWLAACDTRDAPQPDRTRITSTWRGADYIVAGSVGSAFGRDQIRDEIVGRRCGRRMELVFFNAEKQPDGSWAVNGTCRWRT